MADRNKTTAPPPATALNIPGQSATITLPSAEEMARTAVGVIQGVRQLLDPDGDGIVDTATASKMAGELIKAATQEIPLLGTVINETCAVATKEPDELKVFMGSLEAAKAEYVLRTLANKDALSAKVNEISALPGLDMVPQGSGVSKEQMLGVINDLMGNKDVQAELAKLPITVERLDVDAVCKTATAPTPSASAKGARKGKEASIQQ